MVSGISCFDEAKLHWLGVGSLGLQYVSSLDKTHNSETDYEPLEYLKNQVDFVLRSQKDYTQHQDH